MDICLKTLLIPIALLLSIPLVNAQQFTMQNGSITTCGGLFTDSGGNGGNYGDNEDFTFTICSDGSGGNTHVSLAFDPLAVDASDLLCFYDGNDTSAPSLGCNNTITNTEIFIMQATAANPGGCITISFQSDGSTNAAGWSAAISCVQQCQTVLANLATSDPIVNPPDTGWIDICPGDIVTFNGEGVYPQNNLIYNQSDNTSTFEWDFGDGTGAFGPNQQHGYYEPGGYIAQLFVTDATGCRSTNFISQRIRVSGPPTFNISDNIPSTICVYDTISVYTGVEANNADISVTPGSGSFQSGGTVADSIGIPDGTGETYNSCLSLAEFGPGQTLNNIDDLLAICVNIEHSFYGDLEISITCPSGQNVTLHEFSNFSGGGYNLGEPVDGDENPGQDPTPGVGYDYCWVPTASGTWLQSEGLAAANGGTLPAGDYGSFESLDGLLGCSLNGEWCISIQDLWGSDNGVIFNWTLELNEDIYPNLETFELEVVNQEWVDHSSIFINTADSMYAAPQFPGSVTYVFEATDNFECTYDTTINITVLPQTDPACFNCSGNLIPMADATICDDGSSVDLSTDIENVDLTSLTFQDSPNTPFNSIANGLANPYTSTLDVSGLPYNIIGGNSIESICIDIDHSNLMDVVVFLQAPNGTLFELTSGNGGFGDNYTQTCFTPTATNPITGGAPPFTGDWLPEDNFIGLVGVPSNGAWTLQVSDQFGGFDTGVFLSWNITFNLDNQLAWSWTPIDGLSCTDCPNPTATPTTTTTYTVTATDDFNCSYTETVTVTVENCSSCPLTASLGGTTDASCSGVADGSATIIATDAAAGVVTYVLDGTTTQVDNGTFSNLTDGTYQVIVTDTDGCTASVDFTITTPDPMTLTLSATGESCFNSGDGSITSTTTGGSNNYTYNWSNGMTTADISNVASGDYTVTVTDANGCSLTATESVTPSGLLTLSPLFNDVTCFGGTDGDINITASGGAGNYTYAWSTGETTSSIMNLTAGSYTVSVTDDNGCLSSITVNISEPTSVEISSITQTAMSCAGESNNAATVVAMGGTGPYTYQWSSGGNTDTETNLAAGTYLVSITDTNGCTATGEIDITEHPPVVIAMSSTEISCNGGNDGTATAAAQGGAEPYNYIWDNGQTSATAVGLLVGTYTVTAMDANGCTGTNTISVTEPPILSAFNVAGDISCPGGDDGFAGIVVSGGVYPYTWDWSNGLNAFSTVSQYGNWDMDASDCINYNANTTVQNNADTICINTVDGNGNTFQSYVVVSVIPVGSCSANTDDTDGDGVCDANDPAPNDPCDPYAFDMNGNGVCDFQEPNNIGFAYVEVEQAASGTGCFTLPAGMDPLSATYRYCDDGDAILINNLTAGTYTVTTTDYAGCSITNTMTLTEPAAIVPITSNTPVTCFGGSDGTASVTATGGSDVFTYEWSDGQTNDTATGLSAGDYTVTLTDSNGCTETASVTITEPPSVVSILSIDQTIIACSGDDGNAAMVVAQGGIPPYTYAWNSGGMTDTETGLAPGNYVVTVTDANGCTVAGTTNLVEYAPVVVSLSGTDISCNGGNDGTATASATGGTAPYTYLWSDGQASPNPIGLTAGTHTVTVTDSNGCTGSNSITLTEPMPLIATANGQDASCNTGSDGSAAVVANDGTEPYTYLWSNGQTTDTASDLAAGIYGVTVTDSNGCTSTAEAIVSEPDAIILSTSTTPVSCFGGSDGSATVVATGGAGDYSYLWNSPTPQINDTANGLAAGDYIVTVTDANGCTATATAIVTQPADGMSITSIQQLVISCSGENANTAAVTATGGIPPYSYQWSSTGTGDVETSLPPGDYTVTVTDANACSVSASITLVEHSPVIVDVSGTDISCNAGNDGTANASATGGTAPYSYTWDNGQLNGTAVGLVAGTYVVTVTDANGCTGTNSITLTEPLALATTTTTLDVACNGESTGAASVSVSDGTAPYTYFWSNGATTDIVADLGSGTYTVTVTDAMGCTISESVTITQPAPLTLGTSTTPVNCFGGSDGTATVTPTGGTAGYTYLWDDNASQNTATATGLPTGLYNVLVTDANGCTATTSVLVTEPATPVMMASVEQTEMGCAGTATNTATAVAEGGTINYTYQWSSGGTEAIEAGLAEGTYTVTATDANGCTATGEVTIVTHPPVLVTASGTDISCFNGSDGTVSAEAANGTEPYTYAWSNGQVGSDVSGLAASTYTVTATDANGCTGTATVTIAEPVAFSSFTDTEDILCHGDDTGTASITVSGGTPPYLYQWNDVYLQTASTAIGLVAGTYAVTVTDANGCSLTSSVTINEPADLTISTSMQPVSCIGGNDGTAIVSAEGGTPPYSYNWNTGQSTDTISNMISSFYNVTVTDDNGCIATASIFIEQPASPVGILTINQTIMPCSGTNDGAANVSASGGTGALSYLWSNGQAGVNATGLAPGTYTVTITDENGCTTTGDVDIVEHPEVNISVSSTDIQCYGAGNAIAFVTSTSGGTGEGYTYLWSTGHETTDLESLGPGTYTVTVTDSFGCTASAETTVSQASQLTADINSGNITCNTSGDGFVLVEPAGGTPPYSYEWSINAGDANTEFIQNLYPGTYTVTVTDGFGCTVSASATVLTGNAVLVDLQTLTNNPCYGDSEGSVIASANGGDLPYTYIWSTGDSTDTNILGSLPIGDYAVTVYDAKGCSASSDTVSVSQPSPLVMDATSEDVTCFGDVDGSISVTASGGTYPISYSLDSMNFGGTAYLVPLAPGYYSVYAQDGNGCTVQMDSILIGEPEEVTVSIGPEGPTIEVPLGDSVQLWTNIYNAQGEPIITWTSQYADSTLSCLDCINPWVYTLENNSYEVTVVDENGCMATASVNIEIPRDRLVYVPSGFTPNEDLINDYLMVHGKTGTKVLTFRIYDRWGEMVFRADDYDINSREPNVVWDGTFRGKEMNPAVFVWYLEVEYIDGRRESFKGNTTLIR